MIKGYNGWSNRPTWNAALWLGSDEPTYRTLQAYLDMYQDDEDCALAVETMCRTAWGRTTPDGDALDAVDWHEVIRNARD